MADTLTTLISSGADAMLNLFDVDITFPTSLTLASTIAASARVRAEGFTPPVPSVATYNVDYKTVQITKHAAKITLDRTFSIVFRIDANYTIYNAVKEWEKKIFNVNNSFATNNVDVNNQGTITVKALATPVIDTSISSDGAINTTDISKWVFKNVWVQSVTPPTYTTGESGPAKATVVFRFGVMEH